MLQTTAAVGKVFHVLSLFASLDARPMVLTFLTCFAISGIEIVQAESAAASSGPMNLLRSRRSAEIGVPSSAL